MNPLLLAVLPAALAQQPAPPWQEPGEEVIITATKDLAYARVQLEGAIRAQGYRRRVVRDDRVVFPRPQVWKTKLVLHDDGLLELRTPRLVPMGLAPTTRIDQATGRTVLAGAEVAGIFSGPRQRRTVEGELLGELEDELQAFRDALWGRSFAERRVAIREEVVRAWFDGVAPGGAALPTTAERRAWLLQRWLDTADSEAGEEVRVDLEIFFDEVVQRSQAPLTAEEVASANARRTFPRPLLPAGA